jgi:hypothetical protein
MTISEMANALIYILRTKEVETYQELSKSKIELAGNIARSDCWNEQHKDDDGIGGFSQNPFEQISNYNKQKVNNMEKKLSETSEILDFALFHFLSMVKENGE